MKPYAEMTREELKALHDELSVQYREINWICPEESPAWLSWICPWE